MVEAVIQSTPPLFFLLRVFMYHQSYNGTVSFRLLVSILGLAPDLPICISFHFLALSGFNTRVMLVWQNVLASTCLTPSPQHCMPHMLTWEFRIQTQFHLEAWTLNTFIQRTIIRWSHVSWRSPMYIFMMICSWYFLILLWFLLQITQGLLKIIWFVFQNLRLFFFPPRELSVVGCWFHSIVVRIIWYNSNDCFRLHEDLFVAKIQSVFLNAPCMVEKDVSMLLGWGGGIYKYECAWVNSLPPPAPLAILHLS